MAKTVGRNQSQGINGTGKRGHRTPGYHLANVRERALMGLGIYHGVSLLEKLYWLRKESDKPWFRHAAYRAIDDILLNIEAFGEQIELEQLKSLFKQLQEKEGKNSEQHGGGRSGLIFYLNLNMTREWHAEGLMQEQTGFLTLRWNWVRLVQLWKAVIITV